MNWFKESVLNQMAAEYAEKQIRKNQKFFDVNYPEAKDFGAYKGEK